MKFRKQMKKHEMGKHATITLHPKLCVYKTHLEGKTICNKITLEKKSSHMIMSKEQRLQQ